MLISKFIFVADRGIKVPLYFQPPSTTNNSRKIITPTIVHTDILLIRPRLLERFVNCSVIFNILRSRVHKITSAVYYAIFGSIYKTSLRFLHKVIIVTGPYLS